MNASGVNWTEQHIKAAWESAEIAGRINAEKWRKDLCGAWIARQHFGNHNSQFGWEIESVESIPSGVDARLLALQWKNAQQRSGGKITCRITAYGGENVELAAPVPTDLL